MKVDRARWLLLGSTTVFAVSCGSSPTTTSQEVDAALTPDWSIDVNRATGIVAVEGSVSAPTFNNFDSVRLTAGDRMVVTTATETNQLFRREQDLVYRTRFPLDDNALEFRLSLEYNNERFPTATSTAIAFDVSNLGISAPDVVTESSFIDVSWAIGDIVEQQDALLSQRLVAQLLGCDRQPTSASNTSIPLPEDARSTSLAVESLNTPLIGSSDICTYQLQAVVTTRVSGGAETGAVPVQLTSRSEAVTFRVNLTPAGGV